MFDQSKQVTVGQLIELLKDMPPNLRVFVASLTPEGGTLDDLSGYVSQNEHSVQLETTEFTKKCAASRKEREI